MRELDTALICQTVADMVVQANCCIGADVMESLRTGPGGEALGPEYSGQTHPQ